MSKEIQCKCCKEYWYKENIHSTSGLCPNCYDYVADLESKLAESEDKNKKLKDEVRKSNVGIAHLKNQLKQAKQEIAEYKRVYTIAQNSQVEKYIDLITEIKENSIMTFNELKEEYAGFKLKTSEEEWEIVKKTKGNCEVEYNADCYDREVYFDVI